MTTDQVTYCHFCQRAVRSTMHGRHGACVDYYRTTTGRGRIEVYQDPKSDSPVRVMRVDELCEFATCRSCWARPGVQAELKRARRTGEL